MANFPSGFSEINRALVDGDDVFVGNRRAQISRFWTYVKSKLATNDGPLAASTLALSGALSAASVTTSGELTSALLKSSAGSPEGSVTAGVGAICRDTTNGWLWQKETGVGNTGWRIIGASGSYTPTATIVSNLDSVSPGVFQWVRVGNRVVCFGDVTHDPTSSASAVSYRLTLPVASNLTSTADLSGAGGSWGTRIIGDTANDQALVTVNNSVTTATSAAIYFGFEVK